MDILTDSELVLLDTCVYIDIEKNEINEIAKNALTLAHNKKLKLYISEFSFIELILGCDNENRLINHFKCMKDLHINFMGQIEIMETYCAPEMIEGVIEQHLLEKYKYQLRNIRNNIIFPFFRQSFLKFCQCMKIILNMVDNYFWLEAFCLVSSFLKENQHYFDDVLYKIFISFFDNKNKSKRLLYDTFKTMIAVLLPVINNAKFTTEIVYKKLEKIDIKETAKVSFNYLKLKTIEFAGEKNYLIPFMQYLDAKRSNASDRENYQIIIDDAINYIVSKNIFKNTKFDSHDFIDFINISMIAYPHSKIYYSTRDKKWIEFYNYEKIIHPDVFADYFLNKK